MFIWRRRWLLALAALGLFLIPVAVSAESVLQSYAVTSPLQLGLIVQLSPNNPNAVEPLPQTNATKMFGVVVNPNTSPVSLSDTSDASQAYVATSGSADVLVSDQAGPIKTGDYITISALTGIGMKAGSNDTMVLGRAASDFEGTSDSLGTASLNESGSHQVTVDLGRVAVNLGIGRNPLAQDTAANLPGFLRRTGQSIAGKAIGAPRIYIGLVILIITMIITVSLLYSGVRSSITAIGRNPLSKKTILRSLTQVILTGLIVLIIGLFAVYLLLRF